MTFDFDVHSVFFKSLFYIGQKRRSPKKELNGLKDGGWKEEDEMMPDEKSIEICIYVCIIVFALVPRSHHHCSATDAGLFAFPPLSSLESEIDSISTRRYKNKYWG